MSNFKADFLNIAIDRAAFEGNEPARLIYEAIDSYAEREGLSTDDAIAELSEKPQYGTLSGRCGGVNVYRNSNDELETVYTRSDNSTWMCLSALVDQALEAFPNREPSWYDEEWIISRD